MKKRLPHLLTTVRFPLTLCPLEAPMPRCFLTLYLFCGLTDLLDGFWPGAWGFALYLAWRLIRRPTWR